MLWRHSCNCQCVCVVLQEYDNEAESLVSSLSINYDDEDIDIGMYLELLIIFTFLISIYGKWFATKIICFQCSEQYDIPFSAFKLAQVDIYRQRLKERQRRKNISREFGIIQNSTSIGVKRLQANKKKQSKEERDFQDKMRVFAQFHSPKEHEQFFESLQSKS